MRKKDPQKAMWLSLIPGLGQFSNGQKIKGYTFLGIFIVFIIEMILFGFSAFKGLITLGTVPMRDNSMFLMIEGTLQLLITIIFLIFYFVNMYDAKRVADALNKGQRITSTPKELFKATITTGFPYLLTFPAYILMVFVIILPVLVTLFMAFTNYDFNHIPPAVLISWSGLKNFTDMFFLSSYRATFGAVFSWTIIWTLCASTLQIALGIFTAVVAHQDFIKGKKFFGIIFLLPWAVPAFVTIMSFSNIFNDSAGAINAQVIPFLNHFLLFKIPQISWTTDPFWTKVALIMIQGWLGFPYIYVLVTGILQSIPDDLYEAATMDGATALQKFNHITFPAILGVAAPTFITQYTFNFNNFSIIYLFNDGGPGDVGAGGAGNSDILISWIYKLTTGNTPQYGLASAITLIISAIVIAVSLFVFKKSHAFDMEG
ncbi:sugar ABC transporter permease [Liquorilactobacillus vini]|uniref:sugar ABC transporter permease n=1 Tax=Liquorilactobacillus vini TaxID=238015 RepID=UPI000319A06C|nr:sugar ABC transporter permease [Liquorilactobacillus vini]